MPLKEDKENETEIMNEEDAKFFNKLFFKIQEINRKADELLTEIKLVNDTRENLRISQFQSLENYYNKEKLKQVIKDLRYKIHKLKVFRW